MCLLKITRKLNIIDKRNVKLDEKLKNIKKITRKRTKQYGSQGKEK